jgi:hypothetical protein
VREQAVVEVQVVREPCITTIVGSAPR